jgi:hypothetical protein
LQRRAQAISAFYQNIKMQESDLPQKTNLLMKHPDYEGYKAKILGTAFVDLLTIYLIYLNPHFNQ